MVAEALDYLLLGGFGLGQNLLSVLLVFFLVLTNALLFDRDIERAHLLQLLFSVLQSGHDILFLEVTSHPDESRLLCMEDLLELAGSLYPVLEALLLSFGNFLVDFFFLPLGHLVAHLLLNSLFHGGILFGRLMLQLLFLLHLLFLELPKEAFLFHLLYEGLGLLLLDP